MLGHGPSAATGRNKKRANDHDRAEQQHAEGGRVVAQRAEPERRRLLGARGWRPSRSAR